MDGAAPSDKSDSSVMFFRKRRIKKNPRRKAETAQKNTSAARSSSGFAKSLTRASHTSEGTGHRKRERIEPYCLRRRRMASGNSDKPPARIARRVCELHVRWQGVWRIDACA